MADFNLSVTVVGGKEMAKLFENASGFVAGALTDALNITAFNIEAAAKKYVPHDTGRLHDSIHTVQARATDGDNMKATVGTDTLKYARAQEQGFRTSKKGTRIYFKNYTESGTGSHYMQKAHDEGKPILANNLEVAAKRIVNHLAS